MVQMPTCYALHVDNSSLHKHPVRHSTIHIMIEIVLDDQPARFVGVIAFSTMVMVVDRNVDNVLEVILT